MKTKTKLILLSVAFAICASIGGCYAITYEHPIILGDAELCEKYHDMAMDYSHTLVYDFLGIPAHAQVIVISPSDYGEAEILLISYLPPSRTRVWPTIGDIPYWESGLAAFGD